MRSAVTSNVYPPHQTEGETFESYRCKMGVSTVPSCSAESRLERRSKFKLLSAVAAE